jgi:hypothetical protein
MLVDFPVNLINSALICRNAADEVRVIVNSDAAFVLCEQVLNFQRSAVHRAAPDDAASVLIPSAANTAARSNRIQAFPHR